MDIRKNYKGNSTLILMSGIPLCIKSSFYRQLMLLGKGLILRNYRVLLGSKGQNNELTQNEKFLNLSDLSYSTIKKIVKKFKARALILLGYPDQFPFLHEGKKLDIPVFLWAQFSKPQNPESLGFAIPVPLTEMTKTHLVNSGVEKITPVIPHAVDTEVFSPLPPGARSFWRKKLRLGNNFVIGTVGANTLRKRLNDILESFYLFSRDVKDSILLIKTDCLNPHHSTDLKTLAERLKISSKVRIITDELPTRQMIHLYGVMDIYLHLAEWEGFGIPILEAMACSVPVSTQPIQGPGETVPYTELRIKGSKVINDVGTILHWAEKEEVVKILKYAKKNRLLLRKLGILGRREAIKRYDSLKVAEQWIDLIENSGIK